MESSYLLYFDIIPQEILELVVVLLNNDDLENLNQSTELNLNFPRMCGYRFEYTLCKNIDFHGYLKLLSIERLKSELNLLQSIMKLLNIGELDLSNN